MTQPVLRVALVAAGAVLCALLGFRLLVDKRPRTESSRPPVAIEGERRGGTPSATPVTMERPDPATSDDAAVSVVDGLVVQAGTPVPNTHVTFRTGGAGMLVTTDGLGRFRASFTGALPTFDVPSFDVVRETHDSANELQYSVVIEVDGGASISGRVFLRGEPVQGAEVRADTGASVMSDPNGRYRLAVLTPGLHLLAGNLEEPAAASRRLRVELARGQVKLDYDIELDRSGSIAGKLLDEGGMAVAGMQVVWSCDACASTGRATSLADGTYRVEHLAGGGDYQATVRITTGASFIAPPGEKWPSVSMTRGAIDVDGVILRIVNKLGSISGQVVDGRGTGIAGVTVIARRIPLRVLQGPGDIAAASATTSSDGLFVLEGLPVGTYPVVALGDNGDRAVEEGVGTGRADVILQVPALATLRGSLQDFSGGRVQVAHLFRSGGRTGFEFRTFTDAFTWDGLSEGEQWFFATDGTHMTLQRALIEAGPSSIILKGQPARRIAGRVSGAGTRYDTSCLRFFVVPGIGDAYVGEAALGPDATFVFDAPADVAVRVRCDLSDPKGAQRRGSLLIDAGQSDVNGLVLEIRGS